MEKCSGGRRDQLNLVAAGIMESVLDETLLKHLRGMNRWMEDVVDCEGNDIIVWSFMMPQIFLRVLGHWGLSGLSKNGAQLAMKGEGQGFAAAASTTDPVWYQSAYAVFSILELQGY